MLALIHNGGTTLKSRNDNSFNSSYPEIANELDGIGQDMILDGEVVVEDENGSSRFQWLQNRSTRPKRGKLRFYVFDILYFQGFDLRKLTLLQRKKILKAVLPKSDCIIYSEHVQGSGIKAFEKSLKHNGEGIIAKQAVSVYSEGKRSKAWLKIKAGQQQEMVIGGYTEPQGGRSGLGALLCGYYTAKELHYAGKVGTGFTDTVLTDLRTKLDKLARKSCPFVEDPELSGVHWVRPTLVAQIKFAEFTESGTMRHPVFLGLRADKPAKEVGIEKPVIKTAALSDSSGSELPPPKKGGSVSPGRTKKNGLLPLTKTAEGRVTFSNTAKIFWPKDKITKGHVIAYYDHMAEFLLPYLKDRPESLRRTPDGILSEGFFQKNVAGMVPKWIKTRKIKSDSKEDKIEYLLCQDKETLLFLANYGCIEMNPWSSRIGSLNNPDYIIFDLDPKGAPMKNIIATALKLKEILDRLQVPAYIKTSGGNGLHVFIPVNGGYTYEQTRSFSHLVSQMVHRELPEITSLERMPDKRKGMVYLDFLQNGKGKTMASIYSIRPREGAGVSTPLEWSEVNESLKLADHNIRTVPERVAEKGDLWQDFFDNAIDLKTILSKI